MLSQEITVGAWPALQEYDYDAVNRLKWAKDGTEWQEWYGYDARGNRWLDLSNSYGDWSPSYLTALSSSLVWRRQSDRGP